MTMTLETTTVTGSQWLDDSLGYLLNVIVQPFLSSSVVYPEVYMFLMVFDQKLLRIVLRHLFPHHKMRLF